MKEKLPWQQGLCGARPPDSRKRNSEDGSDSRKAAWQGRGASKYPNVNGVNAAFRGRLATAFEAKIAISQAMSGGDEGTRRLTTSSSGRRQE